MLKRIEIIFCIFVFLIAGVAMAGGGDAVFGNPTLETDESATNLFLPNEDNIVTAMGTTNLSLSAISVTTDSSYSSSYNGYKVKDNNMSTKWCSTNATQSHWLVLDLGASKEIGGFTLKNAGAAGESADYNTREYSIHTSNSISGPWAQVLQYNNSGKLNITTHTLGAPVSARYVKLYVGIPSFIDNYARIYEFCVWNYTSEGGNLNVPFMTQMEYNPLTYGTDGRNNCGPASVAMVLAAYGKKDVADNFQFIHKLRYLMTGFPDSPNFADQSRHMVNFPSTPTTTDSYYSADYNGTKTSDANVYTKWCSTGLSPNHWLIYDFGTPVPVTNWTVYHASCGYEMQGYNTKEFTIFLGNSTGNWPKSTYVNNFAQAASSSFSYNIYDAYEAPMYRYFKLSITNPGIDYYARIPEIDVWTGNNYTTFDQMKAALSAYGVGYADVGGIDDVKNKVINQRKPVIVYLNDEYFMPGYGASHHFLVVTGFSSDGLYVYVNDPLRYVTATYSYQTFVTAYYNQGLAVGNGL